MLHRSERPTAPPEADPTTARLRALGYMTYVKEDLDPAREGVTRYDERRAYAGVNVYCATNTTKILFTDMRGGLLHSLSLPVLGWGSDCLLEPYDGASFLALNAPHLARLDWRSTPLWVSDGGHHHDVAVGGDGRIYTLSERPTHVDHEGRLLSVQDHSISVLGAGGQLERAIPLLPLFRDRIPTERFARMAEVAARKGVQSNEYKRESDVLHPNTIELLARDLSVARAGNALICLRELDLVAIIDLEAETLVWSWGPGELESPHQPSVLENGHLLIFDNGRRRGTSRLIELDPQTGEIVWQYRGDPPESFFSDVRGSAQALPNGNVLVAESTKGRVFEVTRNGEIVWEFWNPARGERNRRRQIYRMIRISSQRFAEFSAAPRAR